MSNGPIANSVSALMGQSQLADTTSPDGKKGGISGCVQTPGSPVDVDSADEACATSKSMKKAAKKQSMAGRTKQKLMQSYQVTAVSTQQTFSEIAHSFAALGPLFVAMGVFGYILIGGAIFSSLEGVTFYPDSVYWAVVTGLTIGFGDVTPKNDGTKIFVCFYIFFAVTGMATGVSVVLAAVTDIRLQMRQQQSINDKLARAFNAETGSPAQPTRHAIDHAETKGRKTLFLVIFSFLVVIFVGCMYGTRTLGLSFVDSIYLQFVALSTTGYGEIPLAESNVREFMIYYLLVGVTAFAACMSKLMRHMTRSFELRRLRKWNERGLTRQLLFEADKDCNGSVDKQEFLLFFLEKLGRIDHEDVKLIEAMFDRYDVDGSGVLDVDDLPAESTNGQC